MDFVPKTENERIAFENAEMIRRYATGEQILTLIGAEQCKASMLALAQMHHVITNSSDTNEAYRGKEGVTKLYDQALQHYSLIKSWVNVVQ